MKKLSLDFQKLQVESFETFVPEDRRGTVRANSGCYTASCPPGTCGAYPDSFLEKEGYAATFACTGNACCV